MICKFLVKESTKLVLTCWCLQQKQSLVHLEGCVPLLAAPSCCLPSILPAALSYIQCFHSKSKGIKNSTHATEGITFVSKLRCVSVIPTYLQCTKSCQTSLSKVTTTNKTLYLLARIDRVLTKCSKQDRQKTGRQGLVLSVHLEPPHHSRTKHTRACLVAAHGDNMINHLVQPLHQSSTEEDGAVAVGLKVDAHVKLLRRRVQMLHSRWRYAHLALQLFMNVLR